MALDPDVVRLLRIEIGNGTDFSDDAPAADNQLGSLEEFYEDAYVGNSNILQTALAVWRKRRSSYIDRSFDASNNGELVIRSQKMKFLNQMVARYEILVETTLRATTDTVQSNYQVNETVGAEY